MSLVPPVVLLLASCALLQQVHAQSPMPIEATDWPTYNYDATGTRHNVAEKRLSTASVPGLVEKWRFPPMGSSHVIGAIHATPVVVNGYVYFGTDGAAGITPTVFKLTPDGKVKWSYQNPDYDPQIEANRPVHSVPTGGFVNAALVTADTVYVGDGGGFIIALDRFTGQERWKINTRARPFPGAHASNCVFSAPILADGKIVVAGGGFEHGVAMNPEHECCSGRGFVVALEPKTGEVVWKYDVGPEPQEFDPPVVIEDAWGKHEFKFGPSTSSVWSTPGYDEATNTIYFGTDTHNAPRRPSEDDPRLYNKYSCAVIALDVRTGREMWVTQLNPGDVWNYTMRAYDPQSGLYKDQSIGDTPKVYTVEADGKMTKVVGVGCKNGGFYILDAATGAIENHTPLYTGPPVNPPVSLDPRTLAMPGIIGGLQTGCATDGKAIYTNGIDTNLWGTLEENRTRAPTGGRVVSISLDTRVEYWRHERPKVAKVVWSDTENPYTDVGDPVASGIALANGVAYFTTVLTGKLIALDTATGRMLKEIELGPVWCGPSVSRGRIYVGSGNTLFAPTDPAEAFFPKKATGTLYSFGLPGEDEVIRLGEGGE